MHTPSFDGQHMIFEPRRENRRPAASHARIVYVNGMRTDGRGHAETATLIANYVGTPVHGVFNSSGGFLQGRVEALRSLAQKVGKAARDSQSKLARGAVQVQAELGARSGGVRSFGSEVDHSLRQLERECHRAAVLPSAHLMCAALSGTRLAADVATTVGANLLERAGDAAVATSTLLSDGVGGGIELGKHLLSGLDAAAPWVDDLGQCALDQLQLLGAFGGAEVWATLATLPAAKRIRFVEGLLARNAATLSLFHVLRELVRWGSNVHLIAHSQGNLIASGAISALVLAEPQRSLPLWVYALASPAWWWPDAAGLQYFQLFWNVVDPVASVIGSPSLVMHGLSSEWRSLGRNHHANQPEVSSIVPTGESAGLLGVHDVQRTYLAEASPVLKALGNNLGL